MGVFILEFVVKIFQTRPKQSIYRFVLGGARRNTPRRNLRDISSRFAVRPMALRSIEPVDTAPSAVVAEPTPSSHWIYDIVPQCQFDGAQILDGCDLAGLFLDRPNRQSDGGRQAPSVEVAQCVTEDADEEGLISWLKSKAPAAEANDSFAARWGVTMPDCDDTYVPTCYGEAILDRLNTQILRYNSEHDSSGYSAQFIGSGHSELFMH